MRTRVLLLIVIASVPVFGQSAPPPATASHGFDLTQLDRSADPCVDFYQYACGGWRAKNPLPDDKVRWGRYDEMAERNREKLRTVLEAAAAPSASRSPIERQVGDYYAACMDESLVEQKGRAPLQAYFDRIDRIQTKADLAAAVAALHQDGVSALFAFKAEPDLRNANSVIAAVDQGGLGLPDRDYYLKTDPKNVERRAKYLEHAQKLFELAGAAPDRAAASAKTILTIETALATASMDRIARRDPHNLDHKMTRDELIRLAPSLELARYFADTQAPAFTDVNTATPDFFKDVSGLVDRTPHGRPQDLSALARHPLGGAAAVHGIRGGRLPLQRSVHAGREGKRSTLEGVRASRRSRPWRSGGPPVRRALLRARRQAEDARAREQRALGARRQHQAGRVDVGRDAAESAHEAAQDPHREARLSRVVARLQPRDHRARTTTWATPCAAPSSSRRANGPRSASRSIAPSGT